MWRLLLPGDDGGLLQQGPEGAAHGDTHHHHQAHPLRQLHQEDPRLWALQQVPGELNTGVYILQFTPVGRGGGGKGLGV